MVMDNDIDAVNYLTCQQLMLCTDAGLVETVLTAEYA